MGSAILQIHVSDEERIPDYTDHVTEDPKPAEPKPTEPKPTEPKPTEPQPTEPQPTEPKPTEPQPTEPKPTEPQPTEPKPSEPETPEFSDVEKGSWYDSSVSFMVEKGLMYGVGNGRFNPTGDVTRAMLVTILYRVEGSPSVEGMSNPFTDVPKSWFTDAVIWAAGNGIVSGVGQGRFAPDTPITREQIAAILYRYEGQPQISGSLSAFTDGSKVSSYARTSMIWATGVGLISGVGGGRLAPGDTATRAQIAAILTRYLQRGN